MERLLEDESILFIGPYPPPYGGIASYLKSLLPSLSEQGASQVVIVTFGSERNVVSVEDNTIIYRINLITQLFKVFYFTSLPLWFHVLKEFLGHKISARKIFRELCASVVVNEVANKHRATIVSFYEADASLSILPLRSFWGAKRKIFLTVYGEIYERATAGFMRANKSLINKCLTACDRVMSSSRHCACSFEEIGNTVPIDVVFVGVTTEGVYSSELGNAWRAENSISEDKVLVFFMGRFVREMAVDVVVESASDILGIGDNVMLCLAGASGELSGDVRQLQEDYPGRIVVRENVTQEEKYAMYSAVDMLVAPSFAQRACMGVSIKEGMAASLPIVAGRGGGIPEAVLDSETGYLIDIDEDGHVDKQQFLHAVATLVEDGKLRAMLGLQGRRRALEIFTVEASNLRTAQIMSCA